MVERGPANWLAANQPRIEDIVVAVVYSRARFIRHNVVNIQQKENTRTYHFFFLSSLPRSISITLFFILFVSHSFWIGIKDRII